VFGEIILKGRMDLNLRASDLISASLNKKPHSSSALAFPTHEYDFQPLPSFEAAAFFLYNQNRRAK